VRKEETACGRKEETACGRKEETAHGKRRRQLTGKRRKSLRRWEGKRKLVYECYECEMENGKSKAEHSHLLANPYLGSKITLKCTCMSHFLTFLQKFHKGTLITLKYWKITF
jgi:hypothetical protein